MACRLGGNRSDRVAGSAEGATRAAVEMALLEPRRLLAAATIHDVLAIRVDNAIKVRDYADIWQPLDRLTRPSAKAKSHLKIDEFKPFALDATDLRAALARAPMEFTAAAAKPVEVAIPTPDGNAARFAVIETMVMDPKLAAKFSTIKTYRGQGIDDPRATVRLDYTPQGFHAQVIAPGQTFYVDPYWHGSTSAYASYWYADVKVSPELIKLRANPHQHDHGEEDKDHAEDGPLAPATVDAASATASRTSGMQLRTYRTAVAATAEYTKFHGGTVAAGQAAIVTAINRVTGIYESELTIRLQLIANNDTLVFTNVGTDGYTNNDGGAMLSQNQSTIDSRIGSANYDVGHVFSTDGGGVAYLRAVGDNAIKAGGVTGLSSPTGDAFYVDYVAHEMGHQFGANHTFNTSISPRNAGTAYEPGSGSTIMGYAGITADDLQDNSDPHFSFISFDEIIRHVDVTVPGVGTRTSTGNSVPTVHAGADFTIPANTPFALTAIGSDGNGDALSYSWEQMDLGPARQLENADNGSSPLFRVYNPTTNPTRTFPRLESILGGANATAAPSGGLAERLPTLARAMDFRVTVRDNRSGGAGVNIDDMIVNVVNTGAAFSVTSFNSSTSLAAGSNQTITWNVAGTTGSGINAANVNIFLSTDGGFTFPTLLASNTPNDGTQLITLPAVGTTQARIKVQPTNNIFFDISNANFTITTSTPQAPTIGSLTGSPDPVDTNAALTLTANTVADANGDPLTVSFYRETNGLAGLQTAGGIPDTLVGSDPTSPYAITVTAPAANGSYTWYARATDPDSFASNVVSTTILIGDPDDQISETIAFTFGNTVNGSINPAGDVDMYAITVAAGQPVEIDVDLPGGSPLDSLLRLFNASGTQLALADDNPPAGPAPEYSTLEPYIPYTFATAGTYYVGVSSYQNSTYNPTTGTGDNAASTGPYTLTITTPPTVDITDVTPDPRTDAVDQISILFSEPMTGLDLSDFSLTRDGGPNLLTETQTLVMSSGSSYHLGGLASLTGLRGNYVLTLTAVGSGIADATGNALASGATDAWVNNNALPVVTDMFVGSTAWTSAFRNFLQSSGQGDAAYGYRLSADLHADELMWINLNQVSVRFSEDVNLAPGAFRLFGVRTPQYVGEVSYAPATFTATFTLTAAPAFVNEKLLVHLLADRITDMNGHTLDGEWTNPAETIPVPAGGADSYPSGNGTAGGDFAMRLNVLPGDVTRDGEIVGNDVTSVRLNQGFMPGQSGYSIFRDVTGDGEIIGNDVTGVRSRQGIVLPAGIPIVPIAAPRTADRSSLFASAASISLAKPKLISAYDLLNDEQEKALVS